MKEQWIEDISTKMDGYEIDAPEISWSEIESKVATNRRSRIVAMWQKRIAVAASLLLVIGTSITLFFMKDEQDTTNIVAKNGKTMSKETFSETTAKAENETIANSESKTLAAAQKSSFTPPIVKSNSESLQEISKNRLENFENPLRVSENAQEISETDNTASQKGDTPKQAKKEKKKTSFDYPEEFTYKKTNKQSRLLASAYYGNGVSVGSGMSSFGPSIQQDAVASDYEGDRFLVASPEEEPIVSADHHQPIRFGLSVKYALNDKWGVESGLVYSYLRSDISEERHSYTVNSNQKIGYVGIPVAASYNIASAKQLNFYASAGGMIELPVMAKSVETMVSNGMETTTQERKLPKSSVQMSVSGRIGAEYRFTPTLGIYVEPGLSYYFDNGSSIETAYSDKPLNFNLNVGFRMTIK